MSYCVTDGDEPAKAPEAKKKGSKPGGDRPGAVTGSEQESPEEGTACEEPECRAPVDPRLDEPYVQDHWGQCLQRFVWGRQGGARDTCGGAPQG